MGGQLSSQQNLRIFPSSVQLCQLFHEYSYSLAYATTMFKNHKTCTNSDVTVYNQIAVPPIERFSLMFLRFSMLFILISFITAIIDFTEFSCMEKKKYETKSFGASATKKLISKLVESKKK